MSLIKLFESDYARICYIPDRQVLEVEWFQFAGSEVLRDIAEKALEFARKYNAKAWLANNLKMRTIRASDQEWINTVWFPKVLTLNLEKMAVVESDDAMNRMSIKNVLTQAAPIINFEIQHFATRYHAISWLSEK